MVRHVPGKEHVLLKQPMLLMVTHAHVMQAILETNVKQVSHVHFFKEGKDWFAKPSTSAPTPLKDDTMKISCRGIRLGSKI